jgi:hypothetical protein
VGGSKSFAWFESLGRALWKSVNLKVIPILFVTVWMAHFLRSDQFGFYQDDYYFISLPLGWNWLDLAALRQAEVARSVEIPFRPLTPDQVWNQLERWITETK